MTAITSEEIVKKLHECFDARKRARELRLELIKIAVDHGLPQEIAVNGDSAANYLDGLLAGRGHLPLARKAA